MNQGWIKLHRKLLDSTVFTSNDSYLLQLWIYILLSVNHEEKKFLWNGEEIKLNPGQGIFGIDRITRDLTGFENKQSKRFKRLRIIYYRRLKILEKCGNVQLKTTNKYTIITVVYWYEYQRIETQVQLNCNQTRSNKNEKKKYIGARDKLTPIIHAYNLPLKVEEALILFADKVRQGNKTKQLAFFRVEKIVQELMSISSQYGEDKLILALEKTLMKEDYNWSSRNTTGYVRTIAKNLYEQNRQSQIEQQSKAEKETLKKAESSKLYQSIDKGFN